jgi:hypothetical protein
VREEILQKKWQWLLHTFRKITASVTRLAITWNPQGKRRRGRPKITWKRNVESEMREITWGRLETEMPGGLLWVAFAPVMEGKGGDDLFFLQCVSLTIWQTFSALCF